MKIVIPMAGRGKRFSELSDDKKEYLLPKPMIRIFGKPMVRWAVDSYESFLQQKEEETIKPVRFKDLIFVCLREHEDEFGVSDFLRDIFSTKVKVLFAGDVTRGPAETALLARDLINTEEDILISDCDHHFDARSMWKVISKPDATDNVLGILPLIRPNDTEPSWSYVVLNNRNEVTEIKEKDVELARKRAYGVIGAYYFRQGRYFVEEAQRMIGEDDLVGETKKREFYMSRIYQRMIEKGFVIKSVFVDKGWLLGTPKHLEQFRKTYQPFKEEIRN